MGILLYPLKQKVMGGNKCGSWLVSDVWDNIYLSDSESTWMIRIPDSFGCPNPFKILYLNLEVTWINQI